ncbi:MAG: DMT family transporter [Proteobacteria bacterium]|jgi:drug/metabolite transporter (DMT)-like permease|nr:DMT family transporter [Pseudomonadota bacterium]MDA1238632.1 DMT family transporter [Pseudomonadota bacterium]
MLYKNNNLYGLQFWFLNEIFMLTHIVLVKFLVGDFLPIQIVFIRALSSAVILLPIIISRGEGEVFRQDIGINMLRVGFSSAAITINFFTISQIQLAQVSTIGYLRPATMSLIAFFFLREKQSTYRWFTMFLGFIAIWFAFNPEAPELKLVALLAIFGMFCGSAATILQKHLSNKMENLPLMAWYSVGVCLISAPFAIYFWHQPDITQLGLMIIIGLLATTAQFFYIKAFRSAEASFLAPMMYFHIIPVTIIGFFVFSETPNRNTIIGAGFILFALIFLAIRETQITNKS